MLCLNQTVAKVQSRAIVINYNAVYSILTFTGCDCTMVIVCACGPVRKQLHMMHTNIITTELKYSSQPHGLRCLQSPAITIDFNEPYFNAQIKFYLTVNIFHTKILMVCLIEICELFETDFTMVCFKPNIRKSRH